jgi:hypothetical protein
LLHGTESPLAVELGAEVGLVIGGLVFELLDARAVLIGLGLELVDVLAQQCLGALQGVDGLGGVGVGALELGQLRVLLLAELGVVGTARLELGLVPLGVLAQELDFLLQVGLAELDVVGGALERLDLLLQGRGRLAQVNVFLVLLGQLLCEAVVGGGLGFVRGERVAVLRLERPDARLEDVGLRRRSRGARLEVVQLGL